MRNIFIVALIALGLSACDKQEPVALTPDQQRAEALVNIDKNI